MAISSLNYNGSTTASGIIPNIGFLVFDTIQGTSKLYNSESDYTNNQLPLDTSDISTWSGFDFTYTIVSNGLLNGIVVAKDQATGQIWTASVQSAPQPTPSSDVDTSMGANYYEEDLTTNVKKYFAESFKFDGSQFEMDGDRIVGLKQSFIDTLATDLTNIVNTSISTATLTADTATINQTLTALGINTDLLKTKDLRLVDAQGHEHKLHLGN